MNSSVLFGLGALCWAASPARGSPGFDLGARCASQQVNGHQTLSLDSSTCSVHINTGSHTTHSVHYPSEQPVSPRMQSKAPQQPSKTSKLSLCNGHSCSVDPGDNQPVPVLLLCSHLGLQDLKVSFPSPPATKPPHAAALSFPQSCVRDGHPRCKNHQSGGARSVRVEKNMLKGSQPASCLVFWLASPVPNT